MRARAYVQEDEKPPFHDVRCLVFAAERNVYENFAFSIVVVEKLSLHPSQKPSATWFLGFRRATETATLCEYLGEFSWISFDALLWL